METFLFVFLLTFSRGFSAVTLNTRVHFFVDTEMTWTEAQSYCREKYKDLSTFTSDAEHRSLETVATNNYPHCWIGLHRSNINQDIFLWSDEEVQTGFTKWKGSQPDGKAIHQDCVEVIKEGWADYYCDRDLSFFCYKSTIMENEKKTWEEALKYCRNNYTDLASLATSKELNQVKYKITGEDFVWVGLRFLAGNWFWLNNDPPDNTVSLQECPDVPYRCGGLNVDRQQWENRDCKEKHSFLCDWM